MFTLSRSSVFILALLMWTASALAPNKGHLEQPPKVSDAARTRRSVLTTTVATIATTSASWADTGAEVRGTAVTPFNGLAFQYRGSEFGGLKATDLDEPSVSYQDFMQRLKAGEVKFVEFMAPDGDKAYATFVSADGKTQNPIRIGEGYPIEQHDGYSSPAFAIRAVKNAGVPYKFSVPALRTFKSS